MLKLFQITNFVLRSRGVVFKTLTPTTQLNYLNILKLPYSEKKTSKSNVNESGKKNKRMRVLSSDEENDDEIVKS